MTRRTRGYTVVELMMALAVFASGVTGIIAMQRSTVSSNQFAKNVTIASGIGQAWLSQLAADSTLWVRTPNATDTSNVTKTTWLGTVTTLDGLWQLPAYDNSRAFGPEFDGFGEPVVANGVFCAQIRLTWLYGDQSPQQNTGTSGNGLIRTEVRVFWPRDGNASVTADCNDPTQATVDGVTAGNKYHFVVLAGAVHQPGEL